MTTKNILTEAGKYHQKGFTIIPVPFGEKAPALKGWQNRTTESFNEDEFTGEMNVGIVLGEASHNIVDIDLDCEEAVRIADRILPETNMMFGRESNPRSHRIYRVNKCGKSKKYECDGTLVEYRANGSQTIFPPSTHSGEVVRFDLSGEPATVDNDLLLLSMGRLAAASLLAQHWHESKRHAPALALAGALVNAGWEQDNVKHFIESVCIAAGDNDVDDRMKAVDTTYQNKISGQKITGLPTLADFLGERVVEKIVEWLGIPTIAKKPINEASKGTVEEIFTDSNLSDEFVKQHGHTIKFCPDYNKWLTWNGKHWAVDDSRKVTLLIEKMNREIVSEFIKTARSYDAQIASRYLQAGRINSIAELSKGKMILLKKELDADGWLFNCQNGVLNLQTGKLMPHAPSFNLSYISPVKYDPKAQCPKFLEFLDQIMKGRKSLVDFIQRAAGYSLTGSTREHCFFILNGNGRNGKSTLVDVLRHISGDYAGSLPSHSLLAQKYEGIPNDLASITGKRFVCASEISERKRLDEAKIKSMTGGEPVNARFLNKEWFAYTPQFKIWLSTNELPEIHERNEGIWSRIHCVPFDRYFEEEERDTELKEKLIAEADGILNWILHGCMEWQSTGLTPPQEVLNSTKSYRNDMDYMSAFIAEHVEASPETELKKADLYRCFLDWYSNAWDTSSSIPKQNSFGRELSRRGYVETRGKGGRCWKGIKLISEANILMH